ncbi:YajQ family cyclic di-GMP-binding protein [Olsenella sp. YH-ols2217]|uniref:Nucleotide-binding protein QJ043_02650 n=1 Tax=Kribbibacterium absianum TaxID=3044210 RepID=A0ABT6ZKC4_9ACTN|nr:MULTISPECIES: YajQ family cyclic di-GMP-binding protein [unclassified Olsenella]MDJ1121493.1 YajQ family cyclic di-GMP-binding protein [Olsenella sp. YH-ols2216]MDJ1128983.1 YajQ family cyclic di-GMP-binding protein [Olsenella sp. YH-ols2217]
MAKDSSFDVVSTVDLQEVDNAVQQAARELTQRYDLKGSGATLELSKPDKTITVTAPADFVARQVIDLLNGRLHRRGVDLKAVAWSDPQTIGGGKVRLVGTVVMGIDQPTAKAISKAVRDKKLKCKVTVEDEKVRVSSPSKDTLQQVIAFLRDQDFGIPLQFVNYR